MFSKPRKPEPGPGLRGRRTERDTLDALIQGARSGNSSVLVLRGEAGIGKSALLDYLGRAATGCRVLRVAGVESEMELAFAGLHQLCAPFLPKIDDLPAPQRDALGTALGLRAGRPPDPFLVGLAGLSLLSAAAEEQPVICLIDDAQWLDAASAQTIAFVARRLAAESVVLAFAARRTDDELWAGLPQLTVHGLTDTHAAALLDWAVHGPLEERVRDRILAETRGNPLALLEMPRWFSRTELTFGLEMGATPTLTSRMEEGFRRQLETLPDHTRRLLLVAAAEPLGDVGLLWRAAERLGLAYDAATPATRAGLVELRDKVGFRHPLVRSVTYRSASVSERQAAHQALAEATDPGVDPDRHAWHRAHAAARPDEAVAAELENSAGRAQAQSGLAAAAAFLERAAMLTPDKADRSERQLNAAQAMLHAGTFDAASNLLTVAEHGPLDDLQQARVDVLRARIGFASNRGTEALPLLLEAARRLEPLDIRLALDSYVDALTATFFAGRLASKPGVLGVAIAARKAPMSLRPRRGDMLLQAVATLLTDGYSAAAPLLKVAVATFDSDQLSLEEGVRFLWLAATVAADLWDEHAWDRLAARHLDIIRAAGALSALPLALNTRVFVDLFNGNLTTASTLLDEITAVEQASETRLTPYGAIGLAAFRGNEEQAIPLFDATMTDANARGEGIAVSLVQWARAMLFNGLGRYPEALEAVRVAATYPEEMAVSNWGTVELIEAAARAGEPGTAADAVEQLTRLSRASGTNWALGVAARSAAQLRHGSAAEDLYRRAIDRLERTSVRFELARARLLYGEWLRRSNRRTEAREQLRIAYESLAAMGADAFAERARRELAATGDSVRKQTATTPQKLTAQELHIARLAADGLTNPEIGAELFISPRTVEWHLRKVFAKLGIAARRHLRDALRAGAPSAHG
ncbi:AAA family ATPase [Kribbella sp. NPDC050459]|uniref:AAA family ATPase n=1 Tax=Kribbella sp. NPDC050459 TaxID=3155785 RepID=UPI0033CCE40F